MKNRMAKGLMALLSGGLLFSSGCLPNDYWRELAGELTTLIITSAVDDVVVTAIDDSLAAEAQD